MLLPIRTVLNRRDRRFHDAPDKRGLLMCVGRIAEGGDERSQQVAVHRLHLRSSHSRQWRSTRSANECMSAIHDVAENRIDPGVHLCRRRLLAVHRILEVVSPGSEFINEHIRNEICGTSVVLVYSGSTQPDLRRDRGHTHVAAFSHHGCGCLDKGISTHRTVFGE